MNIRDQLLLHHLPTFIGLVTDDLESGLMLLFIPINKGFSFFDVLATFLINETKY